jgi:ubiquinone/menaquinone biosynthesis C-methylase UbiE
MSEINKHICPWYMGYILANPLRRVYQNPERILCPTIHQGMRVLEAGPGMGFFTLPMARMVGESGRILCIDVQEKMLQSLRRRAMKANLLDRLELRLCNTSSLQIDDIANSIDFALAFAIIHEVPDQKIFLEEISRSLKAEGLLLISEPKGHVSKEEFEQTCIFAQRNGMKKVDSPNIRGNHTVVLKKIKL